MEKLRTKARARYAFAAFLGQQGKRCTPERLLVLDVAMEQRTPFTAEELLRSCVDSRKALNVCRATVFNTLPLLIQAGLVVRHPGPEHDNRYEAVRSTGALKPRMFLVCTCCGKILKRTSGAFDRWLEAQAFNNFFPRIELSFTYVYGECSRCRKKRANNKLKTDNRTQVK